jgi:hypothetical protein
VHNIQAANVEDLTEDGYRYSSGRKTSQFNIEEKENGLINHFRSIKVVTQDNSSEDHTSNSKPRKSYFKSSKKSNFAESEFSSVPLEIRNRVTQLSPNQYNSTDLKINIHNMNKKLDIQIE